MQKKPTNCCDYLINLFNEKKPENQLIEKKAPVQNLNINNNPNRNDLNNVMNNNINRNEERQSQFDFSECVEQKNAIQIKTSYGKREIKV